MKKSNGMIAVIFVLLGCFSMESNAQDAIKAVMKKCENMESMTVSTIRTKGKNNLTSTLTSFNFDASANPALVQEIIAAFQKDREKADKNMENKTGGKVTSAYYTFGTSWYSYNYDEKGQLCVAAKISDE